MLSQRGRLFGIYYNLYFITHTLHSSLQFVCDFRVKRSSNRTQNIKTSNAKRDIVLPSDSENHGINDLQHEAMQYHIWVVDYCTAI